VQCPLSQVASANTQSALVVQATGVQSAEKKLLAVPKQQAEQLRSTKPSSIVATLSSKHGVDSDEHCREAPSHDTLSLTAGAWALVRCRFARQLRPSASVKVRVSLMTSPLELQAPSPHSVETPATRSR
jgi:hypothetical protein